MNDASHPTLTIGSVIRDRAWILTHFIKHIIAIDYPKDKIDCVFIVNDSTDDSIAILKKFKEDFKHIYNRIVIETYNRDVPEDARTTDIRINYIYDHLAKIRNILMSKCKTDYLLSIDSDILVPSNIANDLIKYRKPYIAGLIYNGYTMYPDTPWKYPNIMNIKNSFLPEQTYAHVNNYYIKNTQELKEDKLIEVDLSGAVFMVNRELYKKCKFGHHHVGEDAYFCEQVKSKGHKIYCNLKVYCQHVMSEKELEKYVDK